MKQVLGKPFVIRWQVCCWNEWCNGTEIWKVSEEKPEEPQKCPRCGWSAYHQGHGGGIKPIYDG